MEEKKIKPKNTDCEIMSWIPFEGEFKLELYKIKFPIEIYNAFWDRSKANNETDFAYMKIKELHSAMRLDLSDIYYTNFISMDNLDDGWMFSETDNNLSTIKNRLKIWLETIKLDGFKESIRNLKFEKETITITKDDLISRNYKSKIFLSYMAKKLSQNMKIELTEDNANTLYFTHVNNSDKFRLIGLTDSNFITVDGEKFLYGYYADFSIYPRFASKEVFINVAVGQLKLVSKPFKTSFRKAFNPYILINNDKVNGNYKSTAMIGKINYNDDEKVNKYSWDWSLSMISELIFEKLPYPSEILSNPIQYVESNDGLSILVPDGTHITTKSSDSASGADYFVREKILDEVYKNVSSYNVFNKRPIYKLNNSSKTIKFNDRVLGCLDKLELELLYLNENTADSYRLFEKDFNNIEESFKRLDELKNKKEKTIDDLHEESRLKAVELLYRSIFPNKKTVDENVELSFNYIDYSHTSAISTPKGQSSHVFLEEFLELPFNDNINTKIVEYEEEDYFIFNKMEDLFNDIRYVNAQFNRSTTQFTCPVKPLDINEKTKASDIEKHYGLIYGKIINTILESMRNKGIVSPKNLSKIPTNISVIEKEGYLLFIAIKDSKVYGRINNSKWMEYHTFLLELSITTSKGDLKSLKNNTIEVAIEDFMTEYKENEVIVNLHYHSLKKIMPYLKKNGVDKVSLKVDVSKEDKGYHEYNNDKVSILVIDETVDAEWVPLSSEGREITSLPGVFIMIDENTALSVSDTQSVTQQSLKKTIKGRKEDKATNIKRKIYSKNEPCIISCVKSTSNMTSEKLCGISHQLKRNTSIQHFRPPTKGFECTKLPLPLHLAIISSKLLKIEG